MKQLYILLSLLLGLFVSCNKKQPVPIKILQLNLWYQGEIVSNGVEGIVDIINQTDPDIIFLCEIQRKENNPFIEELKDELKKEIKYIMVNIRIRQWVFCLNIN